MTRAFLALAPLGPARRPPKPSTCHPAWGLSRCRQRRHTLNIKEMAGLIGFGRYWRRGWDSNPRILADQRFSRPPLSTTQPPLRKRASILIINLTGDLPTRPPCRFAPHPVCGPAENHSGRNCPPLGRPSGGPKNTASGWPHSSCISFRSHFPSLFGVPARMDRRNDSHP